MKLKNLLDDLKKDYLVALPIKISKIKELKRIGDWDQVQEEFHKLKGTGKTYGFPEVSILGEFMEKYFKKKPSQPMETTTTAIELLQKILDQRNKDLAFDIAIDPDFLNLQKINSDPN